MRDPTRIMCTKLLNFQIPQDAQRVCIDQKQPKEMEPIINMNTDNSEVQQVIDESLEKVVQDFNEFRERMSQSSFSGAMKLEDLVDLYINNGGQNSYSNSQTNPDQFTALLEDFNKFESTLPLHHVESTHKQSRNSLNVNNEIQESEIMIKEMADNSSQNAAGSFPDSSQTVDIDSLMGAGSSSSRVSYIRYGDLNYYGAAGDIIAGAFGGAGSENVLDSVMRFLRAPAGGVTENANKRTPRRKRVKRKYRGVIETEEETARRMEITKIKNREAAAKAHANRQAHETYIQTKLSKLRRKNEFLKKLVAFLEAHKRINLHPEPLRRTISVPQGISIRDI